VSHMMRELDTVSPVVWPAWCYTGIHTHSFNRINHNNDVVRFIQIALFKLSSCPSVVAAAVLTPEIITRFDVDRSSMTATEILSVDFRILYLMTVFRTRRICVQ
jgi:hypothetical protein